MALNILFMGTPEFSVPILKSIYDSKHKISEVYTQPPRKRDRGQKLTYTPIYDFAKRNKISVRYPDEINTEEEINYIIQKSPDVVVVVAYGKILPSKLLNIKGIKFLNIHASLLPKWRGAAPIQRSIMNLDRETGISIMKIIPKLDAGPVMMKSKIEISRDSNFENISKKLSSLGAKTILKALDLIENGKENFVEQNESDASYAKKIAKEESKINWNNKAKNIIGKINALNPYPGSWFHYTGTRFKILKANEVKGDGKPGEILDDKFTIACSENAIQILELQKEGKRIMKVSEYLKGNNLKIGTSVEEVS